MCCLNCINDYLIHSVVRFVPFPNKLIDLNPSFKTDEDLWECFGKENAI